MRHLRFAVTALCASVLVFAPTAVFVAGPAHADCSGAGDFGAGSGCPPPGDTSGSGGSGGEAWPPTSVDWPPSQDSDSTDSGGKSTPIVLADGQTAPARPVHPTGSASATAASTGSSTSTSTPPTPIVPVGAATSAAPSTAIVAPAG